MDKVRFGRALGYGARHAAKSLAAAVDAATSPDPRAAAPQAARTAPPAASQAARSAPSAVPPSPPQPTITPPRAAAVSAEALRAGRSVFAPVKKATSVVWLQVTGSFFALLAFGMGRSAWLLRTSRNAPALSHAWLTFWIVAALAVALAYFAASNFVRAALRDRR